MNFDEYGTHSIASTQAGVESMTTWGAQTALLPEVLETGDLAAVLENLVRTIRVPFDRVIVEEFRRERRFHSGAVGDILYSRATVDFSGRHGEPERASVSFPTGSLPPTAARELLEAIEVRLRESPEILPTELSEEDINVPIRLHEAAAAVLVHEAFGHGLELDPESGDAPLQHTHDLPAFLNVSDRRLEPGWCGSATVDDMGSIVHESEADYISDGQLLRTISPTGPHLYQNRVGLPLHARFRSIELHSRLGPSVTEVFPRIEVRHVSHARFNRRTRRLRLYLVGFATSLDDSGGSQPIRLAHLTFDLNKINEWLLGVGPRSTRVNSLCDKHGQRLPVTTMAPEMLIASPSSR